MNDKPVIVHIIDDLGRGGAETLLVDLLKELSNHYNIILVNLKAHTDFDLSELKCQRRYVLNYNYNIKFPLAVWRLKRIIKKHKPVLVRSQLYWSTIFARLACPKNIPLVFSLHLTQSDEAFRKTPKGYLLKWMEKKTYKSRHTAVGVTQEVIDDYNKTIGLRGKHYILYNYVNNIYFDNSIEYTPPGKEIRMVAVGNLKPQKNYKILLKAFKVLDDPDFFCDIYGGGEDEAMLREEISKNHLPVHLKGKSAKVFEELKKYDVFMMCSLYEGFGISVAEAMAVGLPLILSDLQVLREISKGNAVYFDPNDENDMAEKIRLFKSGKYDLVSMSRRGKEISWDNYSKKGYLEKLLKIYRECIDTFKGI